jgi:uncharacterized protein YceK
MAKIRVKINTILSVALYGCNKVVSHVKGKESCEDVNTEEDIRI